MSYITTDTLIQLLKATPTLADSGIMITYLLEPINEMNKAEKDDVFITFMDLRGEEDDSVISGGGSAQQIWGVKVISKTIAMLDAITFGTGKTGGSQQGKTGLYEDLSNEIYTISGIQIQTNVNHELTAVEEDANNPMFLRAFQLVTQTT